MNKSNKTINLDQYLSILGTLIKNCGCDGGLYQNFCYYIRKTNVSAEQKVQELRLLISAFEESYYFKPEITQEIKTNLTNALKNSINYFKTLCESQIKNEQLAQLEQKSIQVNQLQELHRMVGNYHDSIGQSSVNPQHSFSFGTSSGQSSVNPQHSFSFGTSSTQQNSLPSFSFGNSRTQSNSYAQQNSSSSSFSFGNGPINSPTNSSSFSFGNGPINSPANSSSFSLHQQPTQTTQTTPSFTFHQQPTQTNSIPRFSFKVPDMEFEDEDDNDNEDNENDECDKNNNKDYKNYGWYGNYNDDDEDEDLFM